MEKQHSSRHPQAPSPQEWETLIDDFHSGSPDRQSKWIPAGNPLLLLDLALQCLLRRDFPVQAKSQLLYFVEEFSHVLVPSPDATAADALSSIVQAVRSIFQLNASDPSAAGLTAFLKEQVMVCATSVAISVDAVDHAPGELVNLVELLLAVINRPNQGPDRQTRAVACECLRELENSCPCLLSDVTGHIWNLNQNERTHASQSYMLLLASVLHNVVVHGEASSNSLLLSTAIPLVPFNIPSCVRSHGESTLGDANLKEIRKMMSFLLERPMILTPLAIMEMVSILTSIVNVLELHGTVSALLKVQFFGLLYSYHPVLCHVVLMLYSHFSDAFAGDEQRIIERLAHIMKEAQHPPVFRLLALHWLLGVTFSRPPDRNRSLLPILASFYPNLFDPLALKAMKLDVLAHIAAGLDCSIIDEGVSGNDKDFSAVTLIEDGLVCVSSFKWLPLWSTETSVAFRMLHKSLTGAIPHSNSTPSDVGVILNSAIFRTLQNMLVDLAFDNRRLVAVIGAFFDRLNGCEVHRPLGEWLLHSMDEYLLPKLIPDYRLPLYFPIFDRISKSDAIPPRRLLELLTKHMKFLVENHGPDTGLRSWSQGSKVLGICRKIALYHHSSRIFHFLVYLLTFTCQFFPDLEVRDNARIYLRMLLCIPGKKLRHILNFGDQIVGVTSSPHPASLFQFPSPHPSKIKKADDVSSYIHIERVIPLFVKQSWSLIIPNHGVESGEPGIMDMLAVTDAMVCRTESESSSHGMTCPEDPLNAVDSKNLLRVMDAKGAEILDILRKHFACIPDTRHMSGFKIKIPCTMWFESESFCRVWNISPPDSDGIHEMPALYASVIKFSSTSKYGSIPTCRVPFLLGEPAGSDQGVVPIGSFSQGHSRFRASLLIEIEPQDPLPGLLDVSIEANGENGRIISGSLQNVAVGMEDMFLKAHLPSEVPKDCILEYYSNLFGALWEVCGSSSTTGRETFPLKGGKGVAAIHGTSSVKLIEISAVSLVDIVERHLSQFVVSVTGSSLVDIVQSRGIIKDVVWKEEDSMEIASDGVGALVPYSEGTSLQITYTEDQLPTMKRNMGTFLVLIFLPPRFHLLFWMEVSQSTTLVRIRTDHWPCLAYVDEYLEALFLS